MTCPVLVTWTAQSVCAVCDRSGVVAFRWFDGRVRGHGVAACPHSPSDPRKAIPVLCVRWRDETPRRDVA